MSGVIHRLHAARGNALVRETFCLRVSLGGGIIVNRRGPVLTFAGARGEFEATEESALVTCKVCQTAMRPGDRQ